MINAMRRILKLLLLVIVLSCISIGCKSYDKHVLSHANISFSFEVPKSYEFTRDSLIENGLVEIGFEMGIPIDPGKYFYDPELTILMIESYDSLKEFLDDRLSSILSSSDINGMTLLERSPVTISGLEAEQVVFSITSQVPDPDPKYPAISRRVYFKYSQEIWTIDLTSSKDIADQVKPDFDHIIESFQFID